MTPWLAFILLLAIGLAMVLRGRGVRSRRWLAQGWTLDLDGGSLIFGKVWSCRTTSPRLR
jgi:hypothetical protein